MNGVNLICFTGSAGVGKDTISDEIIKSFPDLRKDGMKWKKIAFADALKDICIRYLGCSYDDVYTQEGKEKYNDFWGMTNRTILQKIGTEAFRNGFHKDVWVKITELAAKKILSEGYGLIISDCRFDNEAKMALDLGGIVVCVKRDDNSVTLENSEKKHASETGISENLVSGYFENNSRIEEIGKKFYDFIETL